jgi:hypothetical protein
LDAVRSKNWQVLYEQRLYPLVMEAHADRATLLSALSAEKARADQAVAEAIQAKADYFRVFEKLSAGFRLPVPTTLESAFDDRSPGIDSNLLHVVGSVVPTTPPADEQRWAELAAEAKACCENRIAAPEGGEQWFDTYILALSEAVQSLLTRLAAAREGGR